MTIEMIPLKNLRPSSDNPRKRFDDEAIAGLAQSIKTDGLLQNLVAAKPEGRKRTYKIVSGERRYRALSLLVEQGDMPKDVTVPVEVRDDLSTDDALRIAAIENIQRENLSPLEEAEAIATLVESGNGLGEIAAQTGLSENTIKRRLVLLDLSDQVKEAVSKSKITLVQAEALSLGGHDEQDDLLDEVINGWYSTPSEIRDRLIGDAPSVAVAIFPQEEYSGSLTTDLFAEDETTFFDDAEQFFDLQKAAAEKLVADYEAKNDWAELVEGPFSSLEYRQAKKGESGGVVVQLCPSGKVEVHKGLIRRDVDPSVSAAINSKTKATYAKPVKEYFAMHKSAAVQVELLSNPRKAKEVGVADKLYYSSLHECFAYLERSDESEAYTAALEAEATALLELLGEDAPEEDAFRSLLRVAYSKEEAYDLVQKLDDGGLDRLFAFLSLINFGQSQCSELDTDERSVFNRVALDIGVDMRKHWMPGSWFLGRRTMNQLERVLSESGMSRLYGNGNGYKKSELVPLMVRYFVKLRNMKSLRADQKQALGWLPEAMNFPAIDPDAKPRVEQDDGFAEAV